MSSDLLEIFVFAGIAGFLIFKLYLVLGYRTGFESSPESSHGLSQNPSEPVKSSFEESPQTITDPILQNLVHDIKKKDEQFQWEVFLKGATTAFEIILDAFAKGDEVLLKRLCGESLYQEFKTSIDERKKHHEMLETTLIKIEAVKFIEGKIQDNKATLTLEFQSEQIHVSRNAAGDIIDGNPKQIEELFDLWTFERDLSKRNPNWNLVKTSP